ncbi:hypothetical protein JL721_11459 [Aureococcus anophagefferens]|nr:hypothetical protein JL721_11459 [Aureococcus anophagefferens]
MRVLCALLGTVAAWLQPVQPPRRHVLRRHLLEKPADVASTPPATGVSTLVLLRHGESVWNVKDDERFTGWSQAQIRALKVPTGVPLIYHLDERPCEADESDFCALGLGAEPDLELVPRPPPPGCVPGPLPRP